MGLCGRGLRGAGLGDTGGGMQIRVKFQAALGVGDGCVCDWEGCVDLDRWPQGMNLGWVLGVFMGQVSV